MYACVNIHCIHCKNLIGKVLLIALIPPRERSYFTRVCSEPLPVRPPLPR